MTERHIPWPQVSVLHDHVHVLPSPVRLLLQPPDRRST